MATEHIDVDVESDGVDGCGRRPGGAIATSWPSTSCCPASEGYEIVKRMWERDVWTPVLLLTAKQGEYDEADALDPGADDYDYLTGPLSFVVLVTRGGARIERIPRE